MQIRLSRQINFYSYEVILKRRKFIKNTLGAAGFLSLSNLPNNIFASVNKKNASDIISLGKTGLKVSRLAMGTGSNGWKGNSNQTRKLGVKGLADLLNYAYERGVFFWDSADQYGSHEHLKEALKTLTREKIVILSKTFASTEDEMKSDLDRFRKEIGTDYIDIILLHTMRDPDWDIKKAGGMNILSKAKSDGIIKAHGVSCHKIEALRTAANNDWVDVDLVRFNPAGVYMDDKPKVDGTAII